MHNSYDQLINIRIRYHLGVSNISGIHIYVCVCVCIAQCLAIQLLNVLHLIVISFGQVLGKMVNHVNCPGIPSIFFFITSTKSYGRVAFPAAHSYAYLPKKQCFTLSDVIVLIFSLHSSRIRGKLQRNLFILDFSFIYLHEK